MSIVAPYAPDLPRRKVSARKIAANRRNAQRSTGPRSVAGKAISAANARRHGLSVAAPLDGETARVIGAQARAWAGPGASPLLLELAQDWAEAEFDLARVREARAALWRDWPSDPEAIVRRLAGARPAWDRLERYLKRAQSRRRKALLAFDAALLEPDRERLRAKQEAAAAARAAATFKAAEARLLAEGEKLARQAARHARRPPRPGSRQRIARAGPRWEEPPAPAPLEPTAAPSAPAPEPLVVRDPALESVLRDIGRRKDKGSKILFARLVAQGLVPNHLINRRAVMTKPAGRAAADTASAKRSHQPLDATAAQSAPDHTESAPSLEATGQGARQEQARRQLAKQSHPLKGTEAAAVPPGPAGFTSLSLEAMREGARQERTRRQLAKQSHQLTGAGAGPVPPGPAGAGPVLGEVSRDDARQEVAPRDLAKQTQERAGAGAVRDRRARPKVADRPAPRAPPKGGD